MSKPRIVFQERTDGAIDVLWLTRIGRQPLTPYVIGEINNRQFRRRNIPGKRIAPDMAHRLSITQGVAAIAALRRGMIGPA